MKFKPGINHIEFWVTNLSKSMNFYSSLFELIGWHKLNDHAFTCDTLEIYFVERNDVSFKDSVGVRHICFQAINKSVVDKVGDFLKSDGDGIEIIRGPQEMPYTKDYYTVDFYDYDKNIIEVAYTPNMKFK